jgi:hypothetical protein
VNFKKIKKLKKCSKIFAVSGNKNKCVDFVYKKYIFCADKKNIFKNKITTFIFFPPRQQIRQAPSFIPLPMQSGWEQDSPVGWANPKEGTLVEYGHGFLQ